jgi:O-antigen ligase
MKLLRYSILILILWSIPSFTLIYINESVGAVLSYLSISLMMLYYFLIENKSKPLFPFLLLGFSYFIIAGLGYDGVVVETTYYFVNFIKFILVIVFGAEILKNTTLKEIYIILIIGALSIICHALFFSGGVSYGRYSGFYLNPNPAGVICLVGFSLSFGIKNVKLKLIGQLIFSFAGIITLSRYFISIWILLNLISVIVNKKNLIAPLISVVVLLFIISFSSSSFKLNTLRFEALQSIFSSNENLRTGSITNNSRDETWASYYDIILSKPFIGNGYKKIGEQNSLGGGVHNTYLLVLGEAGILPFIILIWIVVSLLLKGFKEYKSNLHYFLLAIVITTFLLVSHTFFGVFYYIFITLFLYLKLNETIEDNNKVIKSIN